MSQMKNDFRNVFLNVIGGLLAAVIIAAINYVYNNPNTEFAWLVNNPIEFLKNLYFRYSIPMRLNMFIWGMTFFIYIILNKYDKQINIDEKRIVREENLKNGVFLLYSFFATSGLIYININIIHNEFASITMNAIGLLFTAVGFLILILARVEIDGLWGPHVYEYKDVNFKKVVNSGLYKHMRHPIYFGQGMLALSTFLVSQTGWFIIFPLLVIITNAYRAYKEEKNLLELYPIEYGNYRTEVKKWWFC